MSRIKITPSLCIKCGACVLSCPRTIFIQHTKESVPDIAQEELCNLCGHCVAICPQEAISHRDFPQGSIKPVNQEIIPSAGQIMEIIKARRSIRAFREKPVEKEIIEKIIDGARFAPSAHNTQSTKFVVIQDKVVLNRIVELTAFSFAKIVRQLQNPVIKMLFLVLARKKVKGLLHSLPIFHRIVNAVHNGKDPILHNAPVLLIFHADKSIVFSDVNATLALNNASLISHALGLGSFYAGYVVAACCRDNSIHGLFSIPKNHQIYGALALGYPKFKYENWIERKPAQIEWL
ncbi:MAG: nitroreductase [Candidatus Brocadia sp.]|nr:nitroreductase [Candidatus Brocadia sp.]